MEEDNILAREFILLAIRLQNFCENTVDKEFNKNIFSVKFKILMFVKAYCKVSPSTLVENLNIAKSNIALFCKQLLNEKYLESKQDEFDHRMIYYYLTPKGEKYITNFENLLYKHICINFEESQQKLLTKASKEINDNLTKLGAK